MTSLKNIFQSLGNAIKNRLTTEGITIPTDAGFKTIMLGIIDLIDTKANAEDVPTKTSDLTNDSDFVSDENYVHTDNNYSNAEKTKVSTAQTNIETINSEIEDIESDISDLETNKQDLLVAGTNIKTINNDSLLGSGNLTVVTDISGKQDLLISGTNIKTINGNSILTSGNLVLQTPLTADSDYLTPSTASSTYQVKGNYATLVGGKIQADQLPSYVDDVIEGYYHNGAFYKEASHTTVIPAETGKIYLDISTTTTVVYRYGGESAGYVKITSGDIVVVDTVEDGNSNAVTSNAVYDNLLATIGADFETYMLS